MLVMTTVRLQRVNHATGDVCFSKIICDFSNFHFILVPNTPQINIAQFGDGVPHSGKVTTVVDLNMNFVFGLEGLLKLCFFGLKNAFLFRYLTCREWKY